MKKYHLFAGNTVLFYAGTTSKNLILHMNNRLVTVAVWCKFHKLSYNTGKCKSMLVTKRDIPLRPIALNNNTPKEEASLIYVFMIAIRFKFEI